MPSGATGGMFGGHTTNGLVLVVDDAPDVRKVVRMTLTKVGYDVLEAEDGEKAIQVINEGGKPSARGCDCHRHSNAQNQWDRSYLLFPTTLPSCALNRDHGVSGDGDGH